MQKKIVGKELIDYFSKKNNKQVTGIKLHVVGECNGVEGMSSDGIYISSASPIFNDCVTFPVGSEIDVSYNRWGSVDTVVLCKK